MRTTRKQFPVKLVDFRKTRFHYSARQSEVESTIEKNGGLCGGTMWRDFELINCPTSTKNLPTEVPKDKYDVEEKQRCIILFFSIF